MRRGGGAPRTKPLSRGRRCPAPLCAQLTVSPCESCRTGRSVEAPRGTRCFALAFFPRPRHFSTPAPVRAPREPRCAPFSGSRADGKACGPAVRAPGRRRARRADSRAPAAPPEAGAPAAVPCRSRPPPPEAALERFALEPLKAENAEGRARPSGHGLPETCAAANACRTAWPSPRVAPRPGCRRRPMALTCGGSPGTRQRPLASACGVGSDQGEARGAGPGARPSGAGWEWAGVARLGRSLGFRVRWVP